MNTMVDLDDPSTRDREAVQAYPKLASLGWTFHLGDFERWRWRRGDAHDDIRGRESLFIHDYIDWLRDEGREDEVPCPDCGEIGVHSHGRIVDVWLGVAVLPESEGEYRVWLGEAAYETRAFWVDTYDKEWSYSFEHEWDKMADVVAWRPLADGPDDA